MRCPHCGHTVRLLRNGPTGLSSPSLCPRCALPIRLALDLRVAGLAFVPAATLAILAQPYLGLIGRALAAAAIVVLAMRLVPRG